MYAGRSLLRTVAGNAVLFVAYVCGAAFALRSFHPVVGIAGLVWPSSGIALALVRLYGFELLPSVFLAETVVVLTNFAWSPALALTIALGDTLEIAVGVWLLQRASGKRAEVCGLRDVVAIILVAALTPVVSATIATTSLSAFGFIGPRMAWPTARAWWIGNALGEVIVAPLILAWVTAWRSGPPPYEKWELGLLGGALVLGSHVVFFDTPAEMTLPLSYLLFPLVMWAAYRYRVLGAVTATTIVASFALWATMHGSGPFVHGTITHRLIGIQLFLGCSALSPLVLGGAVEDRVRAMQARDEFIAVAGHELRTPLAAMLLQVEALQRLAKREGDVGLAERLAKVASSGERLDRLVGQLLDVSRIASGRMKLDVEDTSIASIVRDVVHRLSDTSARAETPLLLTIEQDVIGRWDPQRIEQVVTNLLANAVKYGRGRPVEVNVSFDGEAVISVTDHGIGIDAEKKPRIFDKFERAVASREFGGFGLGLWICRCIVEASGGTIAVESEIGRGSAFTVRLPAAPQRAQHEVPHGA